MKKTMMVCGLVMMLASGPAFAAGKTILVDVNGMVCDFCAQSLKKVFLKQDAVQEIDVSLEKKLITIDLKDGASMDEKLVEKLVVDAGYDVQKIRHADAQ